LKEIQDSLGPHSNVERIVVQKAVQTGLTEVLLNTAAYYLAHVPSTILLVQPNENMAKRLSRQRIEPLIELCEPLRAIIAKPRSRGGNEVSLKTTTRGGTLVIASAQSAAALRSLPARIALLDEVDSYLADLGEGSPHDLAVARTTTFGSLRRIAAVSTPTDAASSLIDRLYRETDRRKWHMPCPFCGFAQTLTWDNMRWEPKQPETARYRCAACGAEIEHEKKGAMLAAGFWKPSAQGPPNVRGYAFNALISPWVRWSELVEQFEAAQDSVERKKTFTNLILAEVWQEAAQEIPAADTLRSRAEPYPEGIVPQGGAFLTAGCDVQADRIECEVVAWGRDFESWSVNYFAIHGDISMPDTWARLDEVLSRSWPHASGMPMMIQSVAIDAGYSSAEVLQFASKRHARRVYGTKGASNGFGRPIWPRRPSWDKNKMPLYIVSSDESKLWVANRMRISEPGPGFMHMPISRARDWYEQMCVEKLVIVRGARRWVNPLRQRNESFDCRALAVCALHSRLLSGLDLNGWCEQFDAMTAPPRPNGPPTPPAAPPPIIRSRWMDF
jgi:phage terminase large subunit GpA-like protein